MHIHPVRLRPGQDLRDALERFVRLRRVRAGVVLSVVGSVRDPRLRFAGADESTPLTGAFEIVALVGTLSPDGAHLHIALADRDGVVVGGHLSRGCAVHTTAEIAIAELPGVRFARRFDAATGYRELMIRRGVRKSGVRKGGARKG